MESEAETEVDFFQGVMVTVVLYNLYCHMIQISILESNTSNHVVISCKLPTAGQIRGHVHMCSKHGMAAEVMKCFSVKYNTPKDALVWLQLLCLGPARPVCNSACHTYRCPDHWKHVAHELAVPN